MKKYKFTIFTPCYNGEKTIHRVFESVVSQTYTNYEWIIVNDGSTDDSKGEIERQLSKYPQLKDKLLVYDQVNKGKHIAWNRAMKLGTGDMLISADCDDSFIPMTLEFYNNKMNELYGDKFMESNFSGINVCCRDPKTNTLVGTPYPLIGGVLVSDNIELEYKYHITGEHWGAVRLDLLKKLLFPETNGHFYTEKYLWYSLAIMGYKLYCFNVMLRDYYYEPQSLTHNSKYKFDRDTAYMYLYNTLWEIRCAGKLIRKYSWKGYLNLYIQAVKQIIKYVLSLLVNHPN